MDLQTGQRMAIKEMSESEGYKELEKIMDSTLVNLNKKILKAGTFEEVLDARGQIKAYEEIKGKVRWARNDDKSIDPS